MRIDSTTLWALGVTVAAITTACTLLVIGIGFLGMPSKPTMHWLRGFTVAMVATTGMVAAQFNDAETARQIFVGLLVGVPAMLWSGFRSLWGVRAFSWTGIVISIVAAIALARFGDATSVGIANRIALLVAAIFLVLLSVDWLRFADRRERPLLQLAIVSAVFGIAALGVLVARSVNPTRTDENLDVTHAILLAGVLLYLVSATIAILGAVLGDRALRRSAATPGDWQHFQQVASARLVAAQRAREQVSLICLRPDDADEIRQTVGGTALSEIGRGLAGFVKSSLPSDALVCPHGGDTFVLLPRADAAVSPMLSALLEAVGEVDIPTSLGVQPSASAGWISTSTMGYDLGALVLMSREAVAVASRKGGNRWERMSATLVQQLLAGVRPT